MKITLLGTGDSAGIPQIGCDCETCRRHKENEEHRTRFSVLIENAGKKVLIDTSPDLRFQFLREGIGGVDSIIFTHAHYDHYAGLGSLYRIIWDELPVYGDEDVLDNIIGERFDYLPFPRPYDVSEFEPFETAGLEFEIVPVHHTPIEAYGVVIRDDEEGTKVTITGDTATRVSDDTFEAIEEPDLLIADGFIPAPAERDYHPFIENRIDDERYNFADKHMTYEGALHFADELGAEETVLVHQSHYYREEHDELGKDGDIFEV
ncbi:MAG: MBL fold metallo-hydrolase [Halobacteria archaeon]|nr:MBL fold metallo-hydrolase [Halobacteria archaeon]